MAAVVGPYESSITAWGVAAQVAFGWMESLSPAMVASINENIALHKAAKEQRIIDRRVRRCKRICRQGAFNQAMIMNQVRLDFSQEGDTEDMRVEVSRIIIFELLKISIT